MDAMIAARAAALTATLDALDAGYQSGRHSDDPLQIELLTIARDQAAAMRSYADLSTAHTAAVAIDRPSLIIPFRR